MSVMSEDKIAVNISRDLYNQVKRRVEESGGEFKNVEDYVEFVLKEVVKEEDEELIKKRLRSLGYM